MSVTPVGTRRPLSAQVAREIKAWMGRLDIRQAELARRLGRNEQWLSTRLRGHTPINLDEMQQIADALQVRVGELLPGDTYRYPGRNDQLPSQVRQPPHKVDVRSPSTARPRVLARPAASDRAPLGAFVS